MTEDDSDITKKPDTLSATVRDKAAYCPRGGCLPIVLASAFIAAGSIYLIISSRGYVGVIIPTVLIAMFIAVWFLVLKRQKSARELWFVEVGKQGITGTSFGTRKIHVPWQEVLRVTISKKHIGVMASKKRVKIGKQFPRFKEILEVVRKACAEKGIECVEK